MLMLQMTKSVTKATKRTGKILRIPNKTKQLTTAAKYSKSSNSNWLQQLNAAKVAGATVNKQ